ncbi:hypothetical protein AKJ09_09162 [Labilithrix luteola]|uniref:Uncharacterized protein n=1 Tax=Labilithrix luteola TaxID=1391654 RepID=A0A0K1Q9T2_9BACT|nr:hypothetical protein AKJ09_09162 [Labilithrix luteola]
MCRSRLSNLLPAPVPAFLPSRQESDEPAARTATRPRNVDERT